MLISFFHLLELICRVYNQSIVLKSDWFWGNNEINVSLTYLFNWNLMAYIHHSNTIVFSYRRPSQLKQLKSQVFVVSNELFVVLLSKMASTIHFVYKMTKSLQSLAVDTEYFKRQEINRNVFILKFQIQIPYTNSTKPNMPADRHISHAEAQKTHICHNDCN